LKTKERSTDKIDEDFPWMITTFATSQMHKQKHSQPFFCWLQIAKTELFKKIAKKKTCFEIFDSQNSTKVSEKVHDFRYFSVQVGSQK
jgi:hypothetical protein